jgi:hypothetical protein
MTQLTGWVLLCVDWPNDVQNPTIKVDNTTIAPAPVVHRDFVTAGVFCQLGCQLFHFVQIGIITVTMDLYGEGTF